MTYPSGVIERSGWGEEPPVPLSVRRLDRVAREPGDGETLVGRLASTNVIDRLVDSIIPGLHYTDESSVAEDEPPTADLLSRGP